MRWHKRQWSCREVPCPRKAFTDQISEHPVTVLGIDETRRGRPRWVQDELTGRWRLTERFETNFVDLAGPQGLLGQTSGRTKVNVIAWLNERGQAWKDAVQIVAMDPCATYRAAVRQALSGAQFVKMWDDLVDGDPTGEILNAWIAKQELRALLATARTGGQRHDIAHRLHRFNSWCAHSGLPELERLAGTIQAWWPEVLGFLQTQVTNAGTEATNRTVKTAARTAYGFRNLDNQRRRVRFPCTRQSRRATSC